MEWIKLTDRMPNPDEHDRVLIYTEGYDFNGEQVFDVKAETLNECFYADPEDQTEVCKHASHWAAHPRNAALHPTNGCPAYRNANVHDRVSARGERQEGGRG